MADLLIEIEEDVAQALTLIAHARGWTLEDEVRFHLEKAAEDPDYLRSPRTSNVTDPDMECSDEK